MPIKVVVRPSADRDLASIYRYIAKFNATAARHFVSDIEARCAALAEAPMVGTARDDLVDGCRTVGFRRRVTIMFRIRSDRIDILRILYGGRDIERAVPRR